MIKDAYISKSEAVEILQKFFQLKFSLDKLHSIFKSRRSKIQLEKFIKNKFQQLLLEIQTNLFRSGHIKSLKFYDNKSDYMFDELLKMDRYFNMQLANDFLNEERCKLEKHEKLPSHRRLAIYKEFVKYAQKNKLFKFSIQTSQILPPQKRPYECPSKLYKPNQLQLINLLYELELGDYQNIAEKLDVQGYTGIQYKAPLLYQNLNNMQLIGLFRCYRKSIISKGGKGMDWGEFVRDQAEYMEQIKTWDRALLAILIRIATRGISSVCSMQIRIICGKIGRRYSDKPVLNGQNGHNQVWSRLGLTEGHKNESEQINKLRAELLAVLSSKVCFHPVNNNNN